MRRDWNVLAGIKHINRVIQTKYNTLQHANYDSPIRCLSPYSIIHQQFLVLNLKKISTSAPFFLLADLIRTTYAIPSHFLCKSNRRSWEKLRGRENKMRTCDYWPTHQSRLHTESGNILLCPPQNMCYTILGAFAKFAISDYQLCHFYLYLSLSDRQRRTTLLKLEEFL